MPSVQRSEILFNDGRPTPFRRPTLAASHGAVANDAFAGLLSGSVVRQGRWTAATAAPRTPFLFDGGLLPSASDCLLFFDSGTVVGTVAGRPVFGVQNATETAAWIRLLAEAFPGFFQEVVLAELPGLATDCSSSFVTGASNPSATPIRQHWFVVGKKIAVINSYVSPVTLKWTPESAAVKDLAGFVSGGPAGFAFRTMVYSSAPGPDGKIQAYAVSADGKYYAVTGYTLAKRYGYVESVTIAAAPVATFPYYGRKPPRYVSFVPLQQQVPKLVEQQGAGAVNNVYALFAVGTELHWAVKPIPGAETPQWLVANDVWERPLEGYEQTYSSYRLLLLDKQGGAFFRLAESLSFSRRHDAAKWTMATSTLAYNELGQVQRRQAERPGLVKPGQDIGADPQPQVHTLAYEYGHEKDKRFAAQGDYASLTKATSSLQGRSAQWTDLAESYEYVPVGAGALLQSATVAQLGPQSFVREGVTLAFNERGQPLLTKETDSPLDSLHAAYFYANKTASHVAAVVFTGVAAGQSSGSWTAAAGVLFCADYFPTATTYAGGTATLSSQTVAVQNAQVLKSGFLHQWSFLVDRNAAVQVLPAVLVEPSKDYVTKVVFVKTGGEQVFVKDIPVAGSALLAAGRSVRLGNDEPWVVDAVYFYEVGARFTDTVMRQGTVRFAFNNANRLTSTLVAGSTQGDVFYTYVNEQVGGTEGIWRIGPAVVADTVALSNDISEPLVAPYQPEADRLLRVTTTLVSPQRAYVPTAGKFAWPVGKTDSWAVCFDTRALLTVQWYDPANAKQINFALDEDGLRLDVSGERLVSGVKTSLARVGTLAVVGNQVLVFVDGALLRVATFARQIAYAEQGFSAAVDVFNHLYSGIVFLEGFLLSRRYADLRGNVLQAQQLYWDAVANDNAMVLWDANRSALGDQRQAMRVSEKAVFFAGSCPADVAFLRYTRDALVIGSGLVTGPIATFYRGAVKKWYAPFTTDDAAHPYHLALTQAQWPKQSVVKAAGYLTNRYPVVEAAAGAAAFPLVTDRANSAFTARSRTFTAYADDRSGVTRQAVWSSWSAPDAADRVQVLQSDGQTDYALYLRKDADSEDFAAISTVQTDASSTAPLQFGAIQRNRYGNVASALRSNGKLVVAVADLFGRTALMAHDTNQGGTLHPTDPLAYVRYDSRGRAVESGTMVLKAPASFNQVVSAVNAAGFPQASTFASVKPFAQAAYFDGADPAFAGSPKSFAEAGAINAYARAFSHRWNGALGSYDATETWSVNGQVRHTTTVSSSAGRVVRETMTVDGSVLQFDYAYDDAGRLTGVSLAKGGGPALAVVKNVVRNFEGRITAMAHATAKGDLTQGASFNIDRSLKNRTVSLGANVLMNETYLYGLEAGLAGYAAGNATEKSCQAFGTTRTVRYLYDDADRLTSSKVAETGERVHYEYGAGGELAAVRTSKEDTLYGYENHVPVKVGTVRMANNGVDVTTLTGAGAPVQQISYDNFGHVASVARGSDSVTFERDAEGKLVAAVVLVAGKTSTVLLYHDWGGRLRCYWVDRVFNYNIYAEDELVGQYRSDTGAVSYFVDGADGSKLGAVGADGTPTAFGDYDDFGRPLFAAEGVVRPLYAGYLYFPSFGFYVTGSRLYFPSLRLYLQQDPLLADPWVSPYAYARNNPVANEDQTGLAPKRKPFFALFKKEPKFRRYEIDGGLYAMKLAKFIEKYSKDGVRLVEDRIFDFNETQFIDIVVSSARADVSFKLGDGARVFLENAMHGNSFVGIGDIASQRIYIHPYYAQARPDYVPEAYTGPYDPNYQLDHLPIRHQIDPRATAAPDPNRGVTYVDTVRGGPSHRQLYSMLREKGWIGEDVFGFAMVINTKDPARNSQQLPLLLNAKGEAKSVLRATSRSINGHENGIRRFHYNSRSLQVIEINGKKVVAYMQAARYEDPAIQQGLAALHPGSDAPLARGPWWRSESGTNAGKFLSQRLVKSIVDSVAAEMGYTPQNDPLGLLSNEDSDIFPRY